MREKQKQNFDSQHQTRKLPQLVPGDSVWLPGMQGRRDRRRKKSHLDLTKYLHHMDRYKGITRI